mmetsp:Transcript_46708/g.117598  ORF Transcript_46708/g.117598 Transcript_46708/m.117598 type:complete len:242 (+) Transcript_46708:1313-2038(+)
MVASLRRGGGDCCQGSCMMIFARKTWHPGVRLWPPWHCRLLAYRSCELHSLWAAVYAACCRQSLGTLCSGDLRQVPAGMLDEVEVVVLLVLPSIMVTEEEDRAHVVCDLEDLPLNLKHGLLHGLGGQVCSIPSVECLRRIRRRRRNSGRCRVGLRPALQGQEIKECLGQALNVLQGLQAHSVSPSGLRDGDETCVQEEQIRPQRYAWAAPQRTQLEEEHCELLRRHAPLPLVHILAPIADC